MFIRGDADGSREIDVSDPILILRVLLLGESESNHCEDALDADDSGTIDISDPIYLLGHLFLGSGAPPAPYPFAGTDPSDDSIYLCSDQELSEGVSTILRGVLIDREAANALELESGYYQVSQFRDGEHVTTPAIVLGFSRQHGECWTGRGSVLPRGSDVWVFSKFEEYRYDASGWSFTVYDSFQNELSVDLRFGTVPTHGCITVLSATINGVPVKVSTSRLDGTISSCDSDAGLADDSELSFASDPVICSAN